MRSSANNIATATKKIAAGNLGLSDRTERPASSIQDTLHFMANLTSTVKQNADNARQANHLSEIVKIFKTD